VKARERNEGHSLQEPPRGSYAINNGERRTAEWDFVQALEVERTP
jgi:hypothetical protein